MEKRMGTLTDDEDGKVSPDPLHSPVRDTETMDEDRIPDTEKPYGNSPTRCTADKNSYTVKGSENSTIRDSTVIGVLNKTVITNEKQDEGVTWNDTEGAKPRVKISVPAKDGGTVIFVDCTNGELRYFSYYRKVTNIENTFGSTWTFRNIFADFMALIFNAGKSDDFFDLFEKLKERYGCEVHKVFQKCLVIEFLHETKEGRDRMIKEKETVQQMFQTFIEGIKTNAPSCTLKVSTEKETTPLSDKRDTESKHIEQDMSEDVSVPSTSQSEQAQAPGIKHQASVSDDESERALSKRMKYLDESGELAEFHESGELAEFHESGELAEFQKQTEASHPGIKASSVRADEEESSSSFHSDEEETSSSFHSDEEETSSSFHFDKVEASSVFDLSSFKARSIIAKRPLHVECEPIPASQVHLRMESRSFMPPSVKEASLLASEPQMQMVVSRMTLVSERGMAGGSERGMAGGSERDIISGGMAGGSERDFGLQPIPVSHVHLCDCRRCSEVLRECENELSTLPNLFFIHFDPTLEDVRLNDSQLQFTKILSAFRNSQGGVLIVHQRKTSDSGLSLHKFINQILDSVLTHDLVTCDVFKSQQIGNYEDVFRIDVEPAEMYVTHDYKTKFPSLSTDKFENASNERIRHLLFSPRTTESTVPALKDISSRQQNVEELRLRGTRPIPMLSYTSKPPRHMLNVLVDDIDMDGIDVDDIMTSHSVAEHITSLSKKKSGGSMFVVMPGLKFDDTPLRQQERFKARLMQTLKKNLRVQKNKHSKVSLQDIDVFKIGLSKDADSGDCILEIAVGHVNGCVFYDSQGPESYKIEGEKIVRLPIERWVEEAFE